MYKVFIENREVVFVNSQKSNQFTAGISEDELMNDLMDLRHLASLNPTDEPFTIYCKDAQQAWERYFGSYQFIHAAGGVVIKEGKWLFIEREQRIDLPKGHLEPNEQVSEGAAREIAEECGIFPLTLVDFIGSTHHTYEFQSNPVLKKTDWFLFRYDGYKCGTPQMEEGIEAVHWLTWEEISTSLSDMFRSIQLVVQLTKAMIGD